MSRKAEAEVMKARRLEFVRYVTRSRTDAAIFENLGIPKRDVCRFANTLTRRGVTIHSEPNRTTGRRYWLAIALVDAERIIDPPIQKRTKKERGPSISHDTKPWNIISDNPACMPKEPS